MAIEKLDIKQFLDLAKQYPVLDVRSPGEYKHAHIPGAYSLALFTDEERATVGTAYKQQNRQTAIKIGLDYFGPKMRNLVEYAESIAVSHNSEARLSNLNNEHIGNVRRVVLVHCWRGGMRSGAVSWLLDMYGFKVYTLAGGYKSFRNYILDIFKLPYQFNILGGYTGSGKTAILKTLHEKNQQIIDLEKIASHKGSAFGNIGMPDQPGQEMFENILGMELWKIVNPVHLEAKIKESQNITPFIWLEDESQRIGQVNIPKELWKTMRKSPVYFLEIPFTERLHQIVQEYGQLDQEKLVEAIGRISQKLGGLNTKTAILLQKEGKIAESFEILLTYYDTHYFKSLHNREDLNSLLHLIPCKSVTPENANQLIHFSRLLPQKH